MHFAPAMKKNSGHTSFSYLPSVSSHSWLYTRSVLKPLPFYGRWGKSDDKTDTVEKGTKGLCLFIQHNQKPFPKNKHSFSPGWSIQPSPCLEKLTPPAEFFVNHPCSSPSPVMLCIARYPVTDKQNVCRNTKPVARILNLVKLERKEITSVLLLCYIKWPDYSFPFHWVFRLLWIL